MSFRLIILFFASLFIISGSLLAQERSEVIDAYLNEPYGSRIYLKKGVMDGNQIRTSYYNHGQIGQWPNPPSGEWPKGSGHSYVDFVCPVIGTSVWVSRDSELVRITPIEAVFRGQADKDPVTGTLWDWEAIPGYANPGGEIPAISNKPFSWPRLWPDPVFQFLEQPDSNWINQKELIGEEDVDDDGDGDVDNFTYWYGYFGRGKKNADLETFFVFDDAVDKEWARAPYNFFPVENDKNRGGLGWRVEVRGFQWSHVLAEDCIFWLYDIINIGDAAYDSTVFGFLTDIGIGGNADSGDDRAMADSINDIAIGYDSDRIGRSDFGQWSPTGYLGYAYLESPGIPFDGKDNDLDGLVDERRDDGIDNDGDWRPYTDVNGNGKWDPDGNEPLNDDVGEDGVGPFDRQYKGPDEGEGDGIPTPGEPHFDRTDIDESDQIGLTSLSIYRLLDGTPKGWTGDDEGLYELMVTQHYDTSLINANIYMLFGAGPFKLDTHTRERFSMALLMGSELDDLIRNKKTVQRIYNANYNFSAPPYLPTLKAVAGDGKVSLFWDAVAEESRDPLIVDEDGNPKKDFEGYLIYRSREPQFNDIKEITDSKGTPIYWKPIAQFDLVDGIKGPDPIGVDGAHFYRGNDTGLQHSFIDEDVVNGFTYYYACVSYDQGDPTYGAEENLDNSEVGLPPTECTKIISEDLVGNVTHLDINCAVMTPNAAVAGYQSAKVEGDLSEVMEGIGSGSISIEIVDPSKIKEGETYEVEFHSEDDEFPLYHTSFFELKRVTGDTTELLSTNTNLFVPTAEKDGFIVSVKADTAVKIKNWGWFSGQSNLGINVRRHTKYSNNLLWPADYKIVFHDQIVDTSYGNNIPTDFEILNVSENRKASFTLWDADNSGDLSITDSLTIIEFIGTKFNFIMDIKFTSCGTPNCRPVFPEAGDEFLIHLSKPFYEGDLFRFTTHSATVDKHLANKQLSDIKVVPNPYIAGAKWEARRIYGAGRGERKIDFIHLPDKCTIRIFTTSGKLVKKIEHSVEGGLAGGSHSWNLVSEDGMDVAYGLYIYHIDAPFIGEYIGKFALIK